MIKELLEYINARILLLKTESLERVSKLYASLLGAIIMSVLFGFFFMFLSITLAFVLGHLMDSLVGGFAIVSGIYIISLIILIIFRKKLLFRPVMDITIKNLFGDEKDED